MPFEKEREQLLDAMEKLKLPSNYVIDAGGGFRAVDPKNHPAFVIYERGWRCIKNFILGWPAEIYRVNTYIPNGRIELRDRRIEKEMTDLANELGYDLEIKYRKKE